MRPELDKLLEKFKKRIKVSDAEYEFFITLIETLAREPDNSFQVINWSLKRLKVILKSELIFWVTREEKSVVRGLSWDDKNMSRDQAFKSLVKHNEIPVVEEVLRGSRKEAFDATLDIPESPDIDRISLNSMILTIKIKGVIYGVVSAAWINKLQPHEQERYQRILNVFSTLIAYILANEKKSEEVFTPAQKELTDITERYDLLQVVCTKIGTFVSPDEMDESKAQRKECLQGILDYCTPKLSAEITVLWVKNDKQWEIEAKSGLTTVLQQLEKCAFEKKFTDKGKPNSLFYKVITDGTPQMFPDRNEKYPEENLPAFKIHSLIAAPITVKGDVEGVIAFFNHQKSNPFSGENEYEDFSKQDLSLLNSIANPLSLLFKFYIRMDDRIHSIKEKGKSKANGTGKSGGKRGKR